MAREVQLIGTKVIFQGCFNAEKSAGQAEHLKTPIFRASKRSPAWGLVRARLKRRGPVLHYLLTRLPGDTCTSPDFGNGRNDTERRLPLRIERISGLSRPYRERIPVALNRLFIHMKLPALIAHIARNQEERGQP